MAVPLRLIPRNLFAGCLVSLRTLLTLGSLVVAIFLLCLLRALVVSLDAQVAASASNRLVVQSAVSLFVELPLAYQGKIEQVEGVQEVTKFQWFGGYYQDPGNFFSQFAVDPEKLIDVYPEIEVREGRVPAFLANRTGCLIGSDLERRFGWKVGDKVPLIGTIFPRAGGEAWELTVEGVYHSKTPNVDNNTLFFHFEYLDETLESGAATGPRGVGVYVLRLAPGTPTERVMGAVDALFENGPQRVQATTEAEFQRQFVSMLGSVPAFLSSIGGGVLFAIVLAVVNTMLMAGRERTRDVGVLKALGFTDGAAFALLLLESLALCLLGGGLGVGLALLTEPVFATALVAFFPGFRIDSSSIGLSLALSAGIGVLAGLAPAWRASRLTVVTALRDEG